MDSQDNNNTAKRPVTVTVASDTEPVECAGSFCGSQSGFVLEFAAGDNNYRIEHTPELTTLVSSGLLSYSLALGSGESRSELVTQFGSMRVTVRTIERSAEITSGGADIRLRYVLVTDDGTETVRSITVTAAFGAI